MYEACLSNILDNQHIDIALITEHELLPRSQHFLSSFKNNVYAYNTCDIISDNYAISGCGKAGTAILFRKSLQNYMPLVNNISNEHIVGIELHNNKQLPLYIFCVYMPSDMFYFLGILSVIFNLYFHIIVKSTL